LPTRRSGGGFYAPSSSEAPPIGRDAVLHRRTRYDERPA
jgi:hypothetical protein